MLKRLICRLLIGALLAAQSTVAAFACARLPGTATALQLHAAAAKAETSKRVHDARPRAGTAPSLCVAHCQSGNQGTAQAIAASPAAAPLSISYPRPADDALDGARFALAATAAAPPSAAAPPHAILHCCLRD